MRKWEGFVVCACCLDKAVAERTKEDLRGVDFKIRLKHNWEKSKYLDCDQNMLVSLTELNLGDGATISLNKSPTKFWMELRVEGENPNDVNLSPLNKRIFERLDEARGAIDRLGTLNDVDVVIEFINGTIDGCASLEKEATDD